MLRLQSMHGLLPSTHQILTKKFDNPYHVKLRGEFLNSYYDFDQAKPFRGQWRSLAFQVPDQTPLDLEIGTGNGFFFAHHCFQNPNRRLVGLELKYKPLHQTLKRMESLGCNNGRGVRVHAMQIDSLFADSEIDNTYIYFPDPWPKKKHHKNRLIKLDFLRTLFDIQKVNSFVEFKTDNPEYFEWTLERFKKSPYKIERLTYDLHASEWAQENFQTHFERLWTSKGLKTMMLRAYRY